MAQYIDKDDLVVEIEERIKAVISICGITAYVL